VSSLTFFSSNISASDWASSPTRMLRIATALKASASRLRVPVEHANSSWPLPISNHAWSSHSSAATKAYGVAATPHRRPRPRTRDARPADPAGSGGRITPTHRTTVKSAARSVTYRSNAVLPIPASPPSTIRRRTLRILTPTNRSAGLRVGFTVPHAYRAVYSPGYGFSGGASDASHGTIGDFQCVTSSAWSFS
jgi:hypothetical protein